MLSATAWNSNCRYADAMQQFTNPVIATNERIILWAVLGFGEEESLFLLFFYHIWAWPFEQTLNPISTEGSTWNVYLVKFGQVVSEEKLFNNIII